MSLWTDSGSGEGRAIRPLTHLERIGFLAGLILSLSPWAGGFELLGQDSVTVTPEVASRLSPALRVLLPALSAGQRVPVIVQFVAPEPEPTRLRPPQTLALLQSRATLAL